MGSSITTKIISLFLAFLLIFISLPLEMIQHAFAESEVSKNQENTSKETDVVNPPAPEVPKVSPFEVTDLRTENSKTINNGDHSYTKEIYSKPIYKKEGKKLEAISTDVAIGKVDDEPSEDLGIQPKSTLIDFYFKPKMKDGLYAVFKQNDQKLSYIFQSINGEAGQKSIEQKHIDAKYDGNKITYENIISTVSLRNIVFNDSVKEDIILSKYEGYNTFQFLIETKLSAKLVNSGEIIFSDKDGKEIYQLPKPFMSDSNINKQSGEAQQSENVKFQLEKHKKGWLVSIVADQEWLKDKNRVYPVYIDPTTKIYETSDTYVSSAYPTTNYDGSKAWDSSLGLYVLKVGNYDASTGNNFAFLKQDVSKYQNATINWAWLNVFTTHSYYPTTATGVWLDKVNGSWNASTLTWNNKPSTTNLTSVNVYKGQWATFDIKGILQDWVSGKQINNGFMLHTNGNGQTYWKKFVSSENTGSDKTPHLNFSYTFPAPTNLSAKTYSLGNQTGYLDLSWNSVPGAIKYRIWIFNGKEYKPYDVGNRTTWSTKDKNIWPEVGLNLPEDPKSYYQSSGGTTYNDRRNYAVTVSAIMASGEESLLADPITPYIPLLKVPKNLSSASFSNGDGTGYVNLKWDPVLNASGYKVWIFNGKEYEAFKVDKLTNWTTAKLKIWPNSQEISSGRYGLHHDVSENGSELSDDPSLVYRNSEGRYGENKNYWFRVSAVNNQGETIMSEAVMPTIPELTSPPNGVGFVLEENPKFGYIDIEWDPVTDAKGYKVWIFNGKEYEAIDVGNITTWSTLDLGIWPTENEIMEGKYKLHLDGSGDNLEKDPSRVYQNSGGRYPTNKNYWIRISAYNDYGESKLSDAFMPTIEEMPEITENPLTEQEYLELRSEVYNIEPELETEIGNEIENDLEPYIEKYTDEEIAMLPEEDHEIEPIDETEPNNAEILAVSDSPYEMGKNKLRSGNFIEAILDLDEDVSKSNMALNLGLWSNIARTTAEKKYPNDTMKRDAYRHFMWNHLSTSRIGLKDTKKITINHEWGIALLNPSINYYTKQYNNYRKKGYSKDSSVQKAIGATVNWIPDAKYGYLKLAKSKYSFFKQFFDADNIMDFHNNYYGRYYASSNYISSYDSAFSLALSKGYLITNSEGVKDSHFRNIWNNKRYY